MRKIPTLFVRDPENRKYVLPEVTPGCEWVLAGEAVATRKYDGTCVMFDGEHWWARREVKPGKPEPEGWMQADHDETTGKRMGWEPADRSAFARWIEEAVISELWLPYDLTPGTFELCGPKVNGNPERVSGEHVLVRHGYEAASDRHDLRDAPRDFDGLSAWLHDHPGWEGIVWHHPDGRMAKLKVRDFPKETK